MNERDFKIGRKVILRKPAMFDIGSIGSINDDGSENGILSVHWNVITFLTVEERKDYIERLGGKSGIWQFWGGNDQISSPATVEDGYDFLDEYCYAFDTVEEHERVRQYILEENDMEKFNYERG